MCCAVFSGVCCCGAPTVTLIPDHALVHQNPNRTFGDLKRAMMLQQQTNGHAPLPHDETSASSVGMGCASQPSRSVLNDLEAPRNSTGDRSTMHHHQGVMVPQSQQDEEEDATRASRRAPRRRRRRVLQVHSARACDNVSSFYCWMSCLDIPNAQHTPDYLEDGYSLYCLDPQLYAQSGNNLSHAVEPCHGGSVLNPACMGIWAPTSAATPGYELPHAVQHNDSTLVASDALPSPPPFHPEQKQQDSAFFCAGGMSMYMKGFAWSDPICVIYLFPFWILSSRGRLVVACLATILLGCMLEWILQERRKLLQEHLSEGVPRTAWTSCLYAIQLAMGYAIMLIVMTYNGTLYVSSRHICRLWLHVAYLTLLSFWCRFICCVLGLVLGNVLFAKKKQQQRGSHSWCWSSRRSIQYAAWRHDHHHHRLRHDDEEEDGFQLTRYYSGTPPLVLSHQPVDRSHRVLVTSFRNPADDDEDDDELQRYHHFPHQGQEPPNLAIQQRELNGTPKHEEQEEEDSPRTSILRHRVRFGYDTRRMMTDEEDAWNIEFLAGHLVGVDDQISGISRGASTMTGTVDTSRDDEEEEEEQEEAAAVPTTPHRGRVGSNKTTSTPGSLAEQALFC